MTYMAPEIKEGKKYDGFKVDTFSIGVILFIIVLGTFPFKEANKEEYYYKMIYTGKHVAYWKKCGGEDLSDDFKDYIIKIFSYDGLYRPDIEELKNHPWMKTPNTSKNIQKELQEKLRDKLEKKSIDRTTESSKSKSKD